MVDGGKEARVPEAPVTGLMAVANFLTALVPFLWFVLAVFALYAFLPLTKEIIESGSLNKIKLGVVEIELAHVVAKVSNSPIEIAKEGIPLEAEKRKQISDRFSSLADKTRGAAILWVDDNHPYQNVAERRVFLAAGISVDTVRTTNEAVQWLYRANYDVVITDGDRSSVNDATAKCYSNSPEPSNAGCALLRKVGSCFQHVEPDEDCNLLRARPKAKAPQMIMYTSGYRPEMGTPAFAAGITNRADDLFNLVLDALEKRQILPKT